MTTSFMSTPFPTKKSRKMLNRTSFETFPRSAAGKAGLMKSRFGSLALINSGVFLRFDLLGSQSASSARGLEVEGSSGSSMTSELTEVDSYCIRKVEIRNISCQTYNIITEGETRLY